MPPGWTAAARTPRLAMPLVESNREENVGCLGPAVSDERIVSRPLEIGVVEVHIGEAMPGRREVDKASACANQRGNAIYQYEVAQVVGAELRLKAVHGVPKWSRHDSCIRYDHVERLPARKEFVGAGADALQTGQIERDQLETATIRRSVHSHLRSRSFGFFKVPRCSCHLRAVGRKSPRRLNPDARGHAGDENAFSMQIGPRQNIVCSGSCSPNLCHFSLQRICSRSAISPGPVGCQPSRCLVCTPEAGMSRPANIASQPK